MMSLVVQLCLLAALVVLAALPARAQQARATVTMTGQVSAFVAVSDGPEMRMVKGEAQVSASRAGAQTVVLSLSALAEGETQIDIPIRLRSNADFILAASCEGRGAALADLWVVGVGGAGKFVYPQAAGRFEVAAAFDGRGGVRRVGLRDLSSPVTILNGPPISMSGTLDSPSNMVEVVLRVVLTAPAGAQGRAVELRVSAAPRAKGL